MPIYEYECPSCGVFELEQRISEDPLTTCPECEKRGGTNPVQRIISASAFHLKGGGWYKTDYTSGKTDSAKSTKTETSSSSATSSEGASTTEKKSTLKTAGCGGGCSCH